MASSASRVKKTRNVKYTPTKTGFGFTQCPNCGWSKNSQSSKKKKK